MVRTRAPLDQELIARAANVRLVLTDCDGVLTDGGVYYSSHGEELKRFSLRDGMGSERLRTIGGLRVAILTREKSPIVIARAAKLSIEAYVGVEDKRAFVEAQIAREAMTMGHVAYIGDDVNDIELLRAAGLSACPADAEPEVSALVDIVCRSRGGHGAFREFAELILEARDIAAREVGLSLSEVV